MKLISWNVNGIRSTEKELLDFLSTEAPDVLMIQELKAFPDQLSFFLKMIPGYKIFWNPAKRKGYSGTAIFYKESLSVLNAWKGKEDEDKEGRIINLELDDLIVINGYFPNGCGNPDRLVFKLQFYNDFLKYTKKIGRKGKPVIIGGDYNVCHTKRDIWSPVAYHNRSPFLDVEREWLNKMLNLGFEDSYRKFDKESDRRTWWHPRDTDRPLTKGLGIDYFLTSKNLSSAVKDAQIQKEVYGSDHCPITLELDMY